MICPSSDRRCGIEVTAQPSRAVRGNRGAALSSIVRKCAHRSGTNSSTHLELLGSRVSSGEAGVPALN